MSLKYTGGARHVPNLAIFDESISPMNQKLFDVIEGLLDGSSSIVPSIQTEPHASPWGDLLKGEPRTMSQTYGTTEANRIREYAKAALAGLAGNPDASYESAQDLAAECFDAALAMLAAEERTFSTRPPESRTLIAAVEDYVGSIGMECEECENLADKTACGECNNCILALALAEAKEERRAYMVREGAARTTVEPDNPDYEVALAEKDDDPPTF